MRSRRDSERKEKEKKEKKHSKKRSDSTSSIGRRYPECVDAGKSVVIITPTKIIRPERRIENFESMITRMSKNEGGTTNTTATTTTDEDILDYSPKKEDGSDAAVLITSSSSSTITSSAGETVTPCYQSYKDGLIRENKKSFDDVTFCFSCEKEDVKLVPTKKRTGMKSTDGENMVYVYRQLFLCPTCLESRNKGLVKVSPRTLLTFYT
jgi:hypothetical protein